MDEIEKARREALGEDGYKQYLADEKQFQSQLKRNLHACDLLEKGEDDRAIKIWEQLIAEGYDINAAPFSRLAKIYRKRKQYEDEVRVCLLEIRLIEARIKKLEYGLKQEQEKNRGLPEDDTGRKYERFLRERLPLEVGAYQKGMERWRQRVEKALALKARRSVT